MTTMIQGPRYRVTKSSEDGEFQTGDVIKICADGSIANLTVGGWMGVADVPAATNGWAIELDREWIAKRRAELEAQLAEEVAQWEKLA